eukprot:gene19709-50620_t
MGQRGREGERERGGSASKASTDVCPLPRGTERAPATVGASPPTEHIGVVSTQGRLRAAWYGGRRVVDD